MPAWEWALAATGAGVGPLVLGFLVWAWIYSTREPPTTHVRHEQERLMTQTDPRDPDEFEDPEQVRNPDDPDAEQPEPEQPGQTVQQVVNPPQE